MRLFVRFTALFALAALVAGLAACGGGGGGSQKSANVLRICNWEDYIYVDDDGNSLADEFEDWYNETHDNKITVEYTTFGTNEILFNNMLLNNTKDGNGNYTGFEYDLVCPSDYMIQKMEEKGMLEKFDLDKLDNYTTYGSPYMKELFEAHGWQDIAIPYTLGTVGIVYNENVTPEEASSWEVMLSDKFWNRTTIKDSVRDTYFFGVALAKLDELRELYKNFTSEEDADGHISKEFYAGKLAEIFNAVDTEDVPLSLVSEKLRLAKNNSFALEVDSGKEDVVNGYVDLYLAWSGDAIFAMNEILSDGKELKYSVPLEGSNIWYDGWVMPKGANTELAQEFINYICAPENAIKNMDYTRYTSAIVGDEVFEYVTDVELGEDADADEIAEAAASIGLDEDTDLTTLNAALKKARGIAEEGEDGAIELDLGYYFGDGDYTLWVYPDGAFIAQYPSEEIASRCTIMETFSDSDNTKVNNMWNRVKAGDIGLYATVTAVSVGLIAVVAVVFVLIKAGVFRPRPAKGYTKVDD